MDRKIFLGEVYREVMSNDHFRGSETTYRLRVKRSSAIKRFLGVLITGDPTYGMQGLETKADELVAESPSKLNKKINTEIETLLGGDPRTRMFRNLGAAEIEEIGHTRIGRYPLTEKELSQIKTR